MVGALALVVCEAIIIVRHHIFFEREFYERRLTLRNDQLSDERERAKKLEDKEVKSVLRAFRKGK